MREMIEYVAHTPVRQYRTYDQAWAQEGTAILWTKCTTAEHLMAFKFLGCFMKVSGLLLLGDFLDNSIDWQTIIKHAAQRQYFILENKG